MTGTGTVIEWYLAREGKQYGPLSDQEMHKLVELGHLRPDDLVWRAGLPDWQSAAQVFAPPPRPAPPPPLQPRQPELAASGHAPGPAHAAPAPHLAPSAPATQARASAAHASPSGPSAAEPRLQAERRPSQGGEPRPQPAGRRPTTDARAGRGATQAKSDGAAVKGGGNRAPHEHHTRRRRRRGAGRVVGLLILLCLLGGGGLALYKYRDAIQNLAVKAATAPSPTTSAPPLKGFTSNVEALDGKLQKSPLWQLLRGEFPEWYQERLAETSKLTGDGRPEEAIAKNLADALVALRRKNADHALAASLPKLRRIAETFQANLVRLSEFNKVACFAFISQSESHPIVVDLMQKPEHSAPIQAQLAAVFDAIAEGRKTPIKHLPPRKADYDAVTKILTTAKGWKDPDLELFSDSERLAKASPPIVCKLVTDWFAAHLEIKDEDMLARLLVEAVRPVVGG